MGGSLHEVPRKPLPATCRGSQRTLRTGFSGRKCCPARGPGSHFPIPGLASDAPTGARAGTGVLGAHSPVLPLSLECRQEERAGAGGAGGRELGATPQGGKDRQPRHARGHLRLAIPHRRLLSCLLLGRPPARPPCVSALPARLPRRPPTPRRPHHFQPHRSRCIYFP